MSGYEQFISTENNLNKEFDLFLYQYDISKTISVTADSFSLIMSQMLKRSMSSYFFSAVRVTGAF